MRNSAFILAFLAVATYAAAQSPTIGSSDPQSQTIRRPRPEQSPIENPGAIIDLDGTWDAKVGGVFNAQVLTVKFEHNGSTLSGFDMTAGIAQPGMKVFTAEYFGQKSFTGKIYVGPRNGYADYTITLIDPDTFTNSKGQTFHRTSPPKLHDIPCDPANSFHVVNAGARARADVAADAGDWVSSFCWISLSASMGNPEGQYLTAGFLIQAKGTEKNFPLAFEWMVKSAEQGWLEAEDALSTMYELGRGTEKNPERAAYWRGKAEQAKAEQKQQEAIDSFLKNRLPPPHPMTPWEACDMSKYSWDHLGQTRSIMQYKADCAKQAHEHQ